MLDAFHEGIFYGSQKAADQAAKAGERKLSGHPLRQSFLAMAPNSAIARWAWPVTMSTYLMASPQTSTVGVTTLAAAHPDGAHG